MGIPGVRGSPDGRTRLASREMRPCRSQIHRYRVQSVALSKGGDGVSTVVLSAGAAGQGSLQYELAPPPEDSVVGEPFTITLRVTNALGADVADLTVDPQLPTGFKLVGPALTP